MHWVDVVAEELLKQGKNHIIASGTSISGEIHIGNTGDIIIADVIGRAVKERKGTAKIIWIMDDLDGLRKVPKQLPPEFEKYLGMPVADLPCPQGCCDSFVTHFTKPLIDALHRIGVYPEIISQAQMYRTGKYNEVIKLAVQEASEIRRILKEVSGAEKSEDTLPFDPVCKRCGKILTTHSFAFENGKIRYRCTGGIAGKREIPGCGYEGLANLEDGKLQWRVEWAARWKLFGVTCEPFGKDHAAAGGSYDTGKVLVREIFNYPPPFPVVYEWIVAAGGRRLSKSAGTVITLNECLNVMPPEVVRYLFFRTKATKHKVLDLTSTMLALIEDYERIEQVYYGLLETPLEKEIPDMKRAYEFAQVTKTPEKYFNIPYSHLISVVQIDSDWAKILQILKRTEHIQELDAEKEAKLRNKIENVKYWLTNYAPEEVKFSVQKELPGITLEPKQKELLKELELSFDKIAWEPETIHTSVYTITQKIGVEPKLGFATIYKVMLGKDKGPRVGYFLSSLDKSFVIERFREATSK